MAWKRSDHDKVPGETDPKLVAKKSCELASAAIPPWHELSVTPNCNRFVEGRKAEGGRLGVRGTRVAAGDMVTAPLVSDAFEGRAWPLPRRPEGRPQPGRKAAVSKRGPRAPPGRLRALGRAGLVASGAVPGRHELTDNDLDSCHADY